MSTRHSRAGGSTSFDFGLSPEQRVQHAYREQDRFSELTQKSDRRAKLLQALAAEAASARAKGVMASNLPNLHAQMGEADIKVAARQLNELHGRPADYDFVQAQEDASNGQAPTQAPMPRTVAAPAKKPDTFAGLSPITRAITSPGGAKPAGASAPAAAALDPFAGLMKTPTGFQAPALRPDGSQMTNRDGTARYVGTLPYVVPPTVQSRVVDSGVGPFDVKGTRNLQTTRGTAVEVDPKQDRTLNWLPKGDPLVAGADRGLVIPQQYRTPGASAIGTGRDPLASITPTAPKAAPAMAKAPAPSPAPLPANPPASASPPLLAPAAPAPKAPTLADMQASGAIPKTQPPRPSIVDGLPSDFMSRGAKPAAPAPPVVPAPPAPNAAEEEEKRRRRAAGFMGTGEALGML